MTTAESAALREARQERTAKFASSLRDQKAAKLAEGASSWIPFTSKDGRYRGFGIPSSTAGKYYTVTLDDCDCPDARRGPITCKHRRALRLVLEQRGLTADYIPTPPPLPPADDKFWSRIIRAERED